MCLKRLKPAYIVEVHFVNFFRLTIAEKLVGINPAYLCRSPLDLCYLRKENLKITIY